MKSTGKSSQITPSSCVVQLIQFVLQFLRWIRGLLDWIIGLLEQQVPKPELVQPPIEQPPSLRRRRAAFDAATAPFADAESGRLENMLVSQNRLLAEKRVDIRFSNHTGLVRTLRGELDPGRTAKTPQEMTDMAYDLLRQYEVALFGVGGNTWRPDDRPVIGSAARFRQVDQGIPVYGGMVLCGFNNRGQMTIVTSSWYPLPSGTDYRENVQWPEASEIARKYVADRKVQGPPPPPLKHLDAVPDDHWQDGRVIFPWRNPRTKEAEYRLGWAALVFDRSGWRSWKVIVGATDGQVLAAAEARVGATLQAHVHLNNKQALKVPPEVCLKELRTVLGGELSSLDGAPDFPMAGDAFDNPPAAPPLPVPNDIQSKNYFRSANIYHHLHRAWGIFDGIVKNVWPEDAPDSPTLPGSLDPENPEKNKPLPVLMLNSDGGGHYNPDPPPINNQKPPRIELGKGVPNYNPEIKDPAPDCEVVYHEYAHAVHHAVQPDIFDASFAGAYKFNSAIKEGIAFYYGCTLSEERVKPDQPETGDDCTQSSRWGEFAYGHETWAKHRKLRRADLNKQRANHDYLQIYGVFPSYTNDPDPDPVDSGYACGIVWARALWDIRCLLGCNIADAIILRGLNLAGGAQSELETPAEAIIHADSEYEAGGLSHENALRLIFCSRGIMADTPIHDLISFELGGQTYLLAAAESGAADPPRPGCLYSTDNGEHWAPLGTIPQGANGPTEVVALAAVKVKQNDVTTKVVIWAVSECWSVDESGLTPRTEVYRYDLQANNPTTEADWQYLADVPSKVSNKPYKPNAFSLAAIESDNANEFSLLVGTEIGLYRYYDKTDSTGSNSDWDDQSPYLFERKVFDLAITTETAPRLLAVDDKPQLSIFDQPATGDLNHPKQCSGRDRDYFLTVVADPDGKHAWVGTAFNGIYHFDLENCTSDNWQPDSTTNRPVHSLEVEKFVEDQETKWRIYAGTNNGVYRCVYPLGQNGCIPFNQVSDTNGEGIEGTSVVALCRTGKRLLAGTAQRGLWWREPDEDTSGWTRSIDGLERIGRLVDAKVPTDASPWSGSLTSDTDPPSLKEGGVGTHILYVPHDRTDALSFTVTSTGGEDESDVDLALYYVTPYTDLSKKYGAGLQARKWSESGETENVTKKTMQGKVKGGYYVLAVKAKRDVSSYNVVGTLT